MKKKLVLSMLVILLLLIFFNSDYIIKNIIDYTKLFITNLAFYTLIMYVIASLLVDYDLLEVLNPKSFITIMSMLSGFPSGAKYTKDLVDKGYINSDVANYLITYTHFPNPLFILGSVSQIITKDLALYILLSIYIGNFITSRIFKVKSAILNIQRNNNTNFSTSLTTALMQAFKTIIIIYGNCIFSLIIGLLIIKTFNFRGILYCLTFGAIDLTKGIFSTILLNNKRIRGILILLFINLASISIHGQVKQILNNTKISYKSFVKGRIVSSLFSLGIFIILSN